MEVDKHLPKGVFTARNHEACKEFTKDGFSGRITLNTVSLCFSHIAFFFHCCSLLLIQSFLLRDSLLLKTQCTSLGTAH